MRIAFVSANREMLPDACIPLGLLYVLAATPSHHEKKLIDLAFAEDVNDLIADELQKFRPELVAIGIRNIQNNDYSGVSTNLETLKTLLAHIRVHTNAPIVLGGAGFSVMPAELMEVLGADYGISGEGEKLFPMLLECIEQGKPPPAGVFAKSKAGQNRDPVVKSFLDLDQLTLPDRSLIDRKYYSLYGTDSIQTSRGCPLHCSYCTYPIIEGSSLRLMDPKRVGDEFEQSAALGAQHVFIVDSVFNMPAVHAKSICRELITRDNPMPWTCYVNPLSFDDELAELMVQAGCVGMEVGSDSGCDDVLRSLRKGFTTAHIRQLHARAQDVGIADCHTFILGTEGETIEHARQTLDFIVDLDPFAAIIMIWVDDFEALDADYRAERQVLRESIMELLSDSAKAFPHWSIPSLGINFDETAFRIMREGGLRGPLWQYLRNRRERT
ncbi:MAG: radical SAM protein [Gammaproteobacteria bacterium]|jgi:radical SAM superfamily enzyme YgiQ (UPF0313 family)|nr:radical SAM protein [Gammaproteobacteria bacterium]MDH3819663.1 radical SAM protein [Gammaproteobacteria bacterium]